MNQLCGRASIIGLEHCPTSYNFTWHCQLVKHASYQTDWSTDAVTATHSLGRDRNHHGTVNQIATNHGCDTVWCCSTVVLQQLRNLYHRGTACKNRTVTCMSIASLVNRQHHRGRCRRSCAVGSEKQPPDQSDTSTKCHTKAESMITARVADPCMHAPKPDNAVCMAPPDA